MTDAVNPANAKGLFYGWIIVAVVFVIQGVSAGGLTYSYSVMSVAFDGEFTVSRLQLMLPMTAMMLAGAIISPLLGPLVDKYPIKRFVLAGALMLALGLWLLSLAPSMAYVIAIFALLMAPVQGLLGPLCGSVLIARWFSRRLALAMGVAAIGTSVGGFVLPPLIDWLSQNYGWRQGMRYLSVATLLFITPLALLVFDRPHLKGVLVDGASTEPDLSRVPDAGAFNSTQAIVRSRVFWLLSVTMGFLFGAFTALISNILPLVMVYEVSRQEGALLISLISAVGIAGKLVFGAVADRIDMRLGLTTAVLLLMLGIGLFALGTDRSYFILASVVTGLSIGGMLPVWGAMLASLFGAANYGRVMGMMSPMIVACNLVAVPLTGFLFDQTGSYSLPLSLFVGLLGLSLLWIPAIKNP